MKENSSALACKVDDDVMVGLEERAERNGGATEVNPDEFQYVLNQNHPGKGNVDVQLTTDNTKQIQGPYKGQFKSQCRFQHNGEAGCEFNVYTTAKVNWEV